MSYLLDMLIVDKERLADIIHNDESMGLAPVVWPQPPKRVYTQFKQLHEEVQAECRAVVSGQDPGGVAA